MSWKFVGDIVKAALGYETNLMPPKHPTQRDERYFDGAVFRHKSPPIDPVREYCGICKQAPCKDLKT